MKRHLFKYTAKLNRRATSGYVEATTAYHARIAVECDAMLSDVKVVVFRGDVEQIKATHSNKILQG